MAALGKQENIEMLISLVQDKSVIYDQMSAEHKDAQLLSNVWTSIAEEMNASITGGNFSADECKRKWRNLRDTYKKVRNEAVTTRSGQATATKRKVPWKYTAVLQFLDKFVAPNRTESNFHSPDNHASPSPQEVDELLEEEPDTVSCMDSESAASAAATSDIHGDVSVRAEASKNKRHKKSKSMKSGPSSSLDEAILGLLEEHKNNSDQLKESMEQDKATKDENGSFCEDICFRMRKMSPRVQSFLKYQISTLLFNAENHDFPQMPIPPIPLPTQNSASQQSVADGMTYKQTQPPDQDFAPDTMATMVPSRPTSDIIADAIQISQIYD